MASTNISTGSESLLLRPWELSLRPSSSAAAASGDNLTALVLAGAGALALAGLALFLARKLRPWSPAVAREQHHRPLGAIRRASPF